MTHGSSEDRIQELERVDREAWIDRAKRVRNAMALAIGVLEDPASSPQRRDEKCRLIGAAHTALGGYNVATESRLRLMEAVDEVSAWPDSLRLATEPAIPVHEGFAVLDQLPLELAVRFSPYANQLRELVLAWRVKTPGRRKGHGAKWAELTKVWEAATGVTITAATWEQTWKVAAQRRAKAAKRLAT